MADDLEWLASWFRDQSEPAWLQNRGVTLASVENPGWWLKVDLVGTALERRAVDGILHWDGEPSRDELGQVVLVGKPGHSYTRTGERWFICGIQSGVFHAAGDPLRLPDILRVFRKWATAP